MFVLNFDGNPPMVSELDGAENERSWSIGPSIVMVGTVYRNHFLYCFKEFNAIIQTFGTRQEVIPDAINYLYAISWGILVFPFFLVFRYVADGLSHTRITMYISFLGLFLNIPSTTF